MMLAGLAWVVGTEIYCAVMQRSFQDTNNRIGKSFAILGIYLFAVGYCKHHARHDGRRRQSRTDPYQQTASLTP